MPVTNHTITVTVNGVDKTSSLLKDSLYIRMQLNSQSSTAELKFKNYQPANRAEISISVNGTVVFGGYIVRRSASLVAANTVIWSCECKDWTDLLESQKVNQVYVEESDDNIVYDLFNTYLPSAGFDASTAVSVFDRDLDITFTDISLREALNQLAERVGTNWYIRPNKQVYWFKPSNPEAASFGISSNPNNSTTFGFLDGSLTYDIDSSTIVNQINIIAGVKSTGTKKTDSFTGDGTSKSFNLTEIPDTVLYCGYNDGIGQYTTYGSFVGYAPQDKLLSEGGSYAVLLDPANKTIKIEGSTGKAPANGTAINVTYYYKESVDLTFNDLNSQALFGTYPYSIENQEFGSEEDARKLANSLLEQNAYGKASIKFDTTKYGLLPGQSVTVTISELGLTSGLETNLLLLENGDYLLLEDNSSKFLLEEYSAGQTFLVQEVSLQPVVTGTNQFMMVCQISAGSYVPSIIDTLSSVTATKTGSTGKSSQSAVPVRLSNISSDLGEVNLGRAAFTDGGTARFSWSNPGGASGAVIGLEDTNGAYGAVYIYDAGTVKAKLGRLDNMPAIGTVTPSGWGLYTTNGFFSGLVYASELSGGTVTGSLVQGGTVSGNYISGGTIFGAQVEGLTIIGGTIATGTPPINSSNPGVYMDSTGLYGYGTVGLTFRLSSDPAIKPYFSSGTILNTIYEINTSSILRTGTTNPRVQIDNSGIFAYDSGGVARFTVDATTGRLTASQGTFSGTVSASTVNGGTVTGAVFTGGTVSQGTVSAATINGGTITGALVSAGTVSGVLVSGGTVSGALVSGGTVTGGLISVVGGSVVLNNSNGLTIRTQSSFDLNDSRSVKFSDGTSNVASLGSGNTGYVTLAGGIFGSKQGGFSTVIRGTTDYSYIMQDPNSFAFWINDVLYFSSNNITQAFTVHKKLIPVDSSSNLTIGDSTNGFRYLYLKDDNGTVRRVSINTSGVLTVT